MPIHMCSHMFCVDLKRTQVDLMQVENRRFMYHPSGYLILGAEDTAKGNKLQSSHAEEYHEASARYVLPPFDDFIRGWIGVGGAYKDGIIHFAPHIPAENIEMFEKAFDFIEAALENGFSHNAILRGFPGAWEQPINKVIPNDKELDNMLAAAKSKADRFNDSVVSYKDELILGG